MAAKKKASAKKTSKKSQKKRSANTRNAYKTGITKALLARMQRQGAGDEEEMPEDEEEQQFGRGRVTKSANTKKRGGRR